MAWMIVDISGYPSKRAKVAARYESEQ